MTIVKRSENEVGLSFDVSNMSSLESLTRFRRKPPNLPDEQAVNQGILKNKDRGEGFHLGGNFKQEFNWTESHMLE